MKRSAPLRGHDGKRHGNQRLSFLFLVSEAKQSRGRASVAPGCFVARAPRNDGWGAADPYDSDVIRRRLEANGMQTALCNSSIWAWHSRRLWTSTGPTRRELSASLTAQATPSRTGTPCSADKARARSVMPAHPNTIASARSSASARPISRDTRSRACDPGSSSSSTATSAARTFAHRDANPYLARLCSSAGIDRESVVTTENLPATRLAIWKAASPMPMTGAATAQRAA